MAQASLPMQLPDGRLRCSRCGVRKPPNDFAWRRKKDGVKHCYCRPCHSEYRREHYLRNKKRYVDMAAVWKEQVLIERTRWLIDFFDEHPCVDCGETDPVVLEFDHVRDKRFDVSAGLAGHLWQDILDEIAKCEVVCGNCHRRRTARQFGHLRALLVDDDGELD